MTSGPGWGNPLPLDLPTGAVIADREGQSLGEGAAPSRSAITAPVRSLSITVYGRQAPKGSMRHVGHGVLIESSPKSKPSAEAIKQAALAAIDAEGWDRVDGPVGLNIGVYFDRPASHPKRRQTWPIGRNLGDSDKFARQVCDALTQAGVMKDDSQVVDVEVHKRWTASGDFLCEVFPLDGMKIPGMKILVWTVPPDA